MKTQARTVRVGYAVDSGEPIEIPIGHLCITGQSQQAGKTTALEGLLARGPSRAVAFITKRGEGSFAGVNGTPRVQHIPPYFRERADWQFVASLIDATMGEKNRFLRSFLMKACRNTKTLAEVLASVRSLKGSAKGFLESIYTEIEGYLELVVPQVQSLPPAGSLRLGDGLNVMDLSPYRTELQGLVIRSVLEHVYEREQDVVTVIPEAWEFLPEQRGSPVKLAFEALVRKGAALRNYAWIDSQDLAGVWKLAIRACPVILLGVQREANEIRRTLQNIPAGIAKPGAADIATLEIGQFYACWGRHAVKVYAQPAWLDDPLAKAHATGRYPKLPTPDESSRPRQRASELAASRSGFDREDSAILHPKETTVTKTEADEIRAENARLKETIRRLEARLDHEAPSMAPLETPIRAIVPSAPPVDGDQFEALYLAIVGRLTRDAPQLLKVAAVHPEIVVEVTRRVVEIDGASLRGRLARLIARGFFDEGPRTQGAARAELGRTGSLPNSGQLSTLFGEFVRAGYLTLEGAGGYERAATCKATERELQAI